MFESPPDKIVWFYGEYQPMFEDMKATIPNIDFVEGMPTRFDDLIDPTQRNLFVIDDLMSEMSNSKELTNLVIRKCHHQCYDVILIQQNLFNKGKETRNISLNCHYLCLFSNPRDRAQVNHLARQMYPGNAKFLQEAYADACSKPFGYLLIDLKQETEEPYRLRTNIFPGELQYVYVKKP